MWNQFLVNLFLVCLYALTKVLSQTWRPPFHQDLGLWEKFYLGVQRLIPGPRGATSSSFRGGGNFHELSFDDVIVLIQTRYNFFANSHWYVLVATFENENLLVLIRSITRSRSEANTKNVFAPLEKCVGHSLKIWAPPRKLFVPSGVTGWLRACF